VRGNTDGAALARKTWRDEKAMEEGARRSLEPLKLFGSNGIQFTVASVVEKKIEKCSFLTSLLKIRRRLPKDQRSQSTDHPEITDQL
jgi:hypothetical protein